LSVWMSVFLLFSENLLKSPKIRAVANTQPTQF
jgi:hypothetical protein